MASAESAVVPVEPSPVVPAQPQVGGIVAGSWDLTARGKGRLKSRAIQTSVQLVKRLTSLSQEQSENGEKESDPAARYPSTMAAGWVTRIQASTAKQHRTSEHIRKSQPFLMAATPFAEQLQAIWTLEYLAGAMGADKQDWTTFCSEAKRNAFLIGDLGRNAYGSNYHVREPETQRLPMAFPGFVDSIKAWQSRRLLFQETVMQWQAASKQLEVCRGVGPGASKDMKDRLDWQWLRRLLHGHSIGGVSSIQLQIGSAAALLPACYQPHDRLLFQVVGRQRILLISPDQAFKGLYPYPTHHLYDRFSMVNFEKPRLDIWPKFENVRGRVAILSPGDVLYIPPFWFVHEQLLEKVNIALEVNLAPGLRLRAPASIPLQVSRLLEERVAEAEGIPNVRQWLQIMGDVEEEEWIDLATVKGYCRIVLVQEVRDEVDLNVGREGAWAEVLPGFVDARLFPTPWLNKHAVQNLARDLSIGQTYPAVQKFREPLYLLDKPVLLQDNRTEEERKYPELFRSKLQGGSLSRDESS